MLDFKTYSELCETLSQWASEYSAGTPSVPDDVYDRNYLLLKEFEAANPDFILDTSPTRRVIDSAEGFRKVRHEIPMISISNSNGIDEAVGWASDTLARIDREGPLPAPGKSPLELEYKLDGLSLALRYRDGQLVDAVTRGKDNVGDSVFENALRVKGVLGRIPLQGDVEIRGETVWKYADFDPVNEELEAAGKKPFSNPRNGAAGTLKSHDPYEVARRGLSFVAYLIVKGSPNRHQDEDIATLSAIGFEVPENHVVNSVEEFREVAESMRARRFEQAYTIDGVVIKVNDKSVQPSFGYTAKSPNFYRAYKFPPEEKETELLDIEQSIGPSGAITPVAVVRPVSLAMTTVSRCSLHNWDLVEYLGLHRNCHVVIRKAGEIIPELVRCSETGQSKDTYEALRAEYDRKRIPHVAPYSGNVPSERYVRPASCPYCGSALRCQVNAEGRELVNWVCGNDDCLAQITGKISNFVSRDCMNIMGVGESLVEELVESGKVRFFDDLYRLTVDDIVGLCGKREASARKVVESIEKSRGNFLHQLIEGFSIPGLGHQAAPAVAQCVSEAGGLSRFVCGFPEESAGFLKDFAVKASEKGVSDLVSNRFAEFITSHYDAVREFVTMDVAQQVKQVQSAKLAGKVCIMTGVFEKLDRDVFKDMVVANGGTICSSITKKCNVVLMGEGAGPSKVQKIKELQAAGQRIDVYTPETLGKFLELLN